jgi:hypothetical protein
MDNKSCPDSSGCDMRSHNRIQYAGNPLAPAHMPNWQGSVNSPVPHELPIAPSKAVHGLGRSLLIQEKTIREATEKLHAAYLPLKDDQFESESMYRFHRNR